MRGSWSRHVAVVTALALVAAACGKDRDDSTGTTQPPSTVAPTTVAGPATTAEPASTVDTAASNTTAAPADTAATTATTAAVPDVAMFGTDPWPCGPGDGANTDSGDEVGVTADSVRIATGDDAGYTGSPGLNHEMTDAMEAFVAACNDLGGINGRQIQLDYYDAKVFDVVPQIVAACDAGTFFLVGEGWAFDVQQEETRLACGLPAVPTFATGAAFAHGKDVFASVPNPSDEASAGYYAQLARLYPDEVTRTAALVGQFAATQEARDRAIAASEQFGFQWVSTDIEYNPVGEADWTPFVKEIRDSGAALVYWSGTCLPSLQLFAQTAVANGLDLPIISDANQYAQVCAEANAGGAMNNLHVRVSSIPFEEADVNPPTQQFIDLVTASGGDISLLGTQTASSFLLWATAATKCGAELTRACTLENLKNTTSWTGHGLHAETNPGGNHPSACNIILRLQDTEYVRLTPEARGTYECNEAWVVPVPPTPGLIAAMLDENRISQQFAGG